MVGLPSLVCKQSSLSPTDAVLTTNTVTSNGYCAITTCSCTLAWGAPNAYGSASNCVGLCQAIRSGSPNVGFCGCALGMSVGTTVVWSDAVQSNAAAALQSAASFEFNAATIAINPTQQICATDYCNTALSCPAVPSPSAPPPAGSGGGGTTGGGGGAVGGAGAAVTSAAGLALGAVIGIAVGGVVFLVAIIVCLSCLFCKACQRKPKALAAAAPVVVINTAAPPHWQAPPSLPAGWQQHSPAAIIAAAPPPHWQAPPSLPAGWQQHGPDAEGHCWYTDAAGNSHWFLPAPVASR
jgi:hypothetical protein